LIVQLEVVIGKKVRDADGRKAGRLEEVHGDWQGEHCVITHYEIATSAFTFVLRLLGMYGSIKKLVVPWDKIDWSDPKRPRLTCRIADLTLV
jgi:sporulation protein YlmC with PRC-barrel domain